ncbi:LPS translocon maturation chaperone LptM [Aliikangiella coralliicola]|uniref:Lipoprotein n=1 Tax=Aliikangiella coralliicola TaxID=2592383 RepID=A0A545UGD1_9GAMM|nr:lipoprotein [Aliikangiella coralliicola]TQV88528.1 lipoprotein [Aliikangiella coralliicola]
MQLRRIVVVFGIVLISACGQKGPLTLDEQADREQKPPTQASSDANDGSEQQPVSNQEKRNQQESKR